MKKETQTEARKIEAKTGAPIQFIVAHFVSTGEQRAKALTKEQINAIYKKQKREEAEAERGGKIYIMSPEFSRSILEGCYILAYNDHRRDIIKAYL